MSNNIFTFKQFAVRQEGSAMKVGTDGVLLGAWCSIPSDAGRALDIGTGTGLIALMTAQRGTKIMVDAIEIDAMSAEQAQRNVADSPWADRITVIRDDIREFAAAEQCIYDLLVTNPPYFTESLLPPDKARTTARHTTLLDHGQLVAAAAKLLGAEGIFATILPFAQAETFIALAIRNGLHLARRTDVCPTPDSPPKRTLMEFSRRITIRPSTGILVIESGQRHRYSEEYKALTQDFYLKFQT